MAQNNETEKKEDWLNEHGEPDFKYLKSLADDGSQEALEKLKSIASDLDVEYSADTSIDDLIERIRSVVSDNEDAGPQPTN